MALKRISIVCLLVYLLSGICSAQLDYSFQMSINEQDYICNQLQVADPTTSPPAQQASPCSFTPCMLEFINATLKLGEKHESRLPTGPELACSSFKVYFSCFENMVRNVCSFTPEMLAEFENSILKGLREMVDFYDENCMCLDSAEVNPNCQNKGPCELFDPCLNGGQCLSEPLQKRTCDSKCQRRNDPTDFEFVRCKCPRGFCGKFCQNRKNGEKCRKFDECRCPDGYGGPVCTMRCEDIKKDKRALYHACLQVTTDDYYDLTFPSQCNLNFDMGQCIAATAQKCGFDPADVGDENRLGYWINAVELIPLEMGGCIMFGDRPRIR